MGREKKRLSGWFFKYKALGKRQFSSQTTIPTSKEKKPGLNGPDRRWCLVVTWGWQRALSAVIPCTASEEKGSYVCPTEIGCKLLIRSASSMAFFFFLFPYWQKLEGISMLPREVSCGCTQLYHREGAQQRNPWQKDGKLG